MSSRYIDPIIEKYRSLIMTNCSSIKSFFQGEPTRIPASLLPCLIISKSQTEVRQFTNAEDEHAIGLNIILITDIRQDLSTNENDSKIVEGISSLYDIIEGRNADYALKNTSILGILRTNQLVDVDNNLRTDLRTISRVAYGETLRDRNAEQWTIEARLQVVATYSQVR